MDRPGSHALRHFLKSSSSNLASANLALEALETALKVDTCQDLASENKTITDIDSLYGASMLKLSEELSDTECSPQSLFISSILLLAIELLQRRRQNGLKHGTGVIQSQLLASQDAHERGVIAHLCRIYDLESLMYSEGVRLPRMATVDPGSIHASADPLELECYCIQAIHHAHAFVARVHHDTVLNGAVTEVSTCSSYIEPLEAAKRQLDTHLATIADSPSRSVFLMLQNLITMTILQLKQLYAVRESQWDAHRDEFAAIVRNVDLLFQESPAGRSTDRRPFTLLVGVIPPLQLVALKCRHISLRKQAIVQLEQAGQEGPFIGSQAAAMATACMAIEGQLFGRGSSTAASSSDISPEGGTGREIQLPEEGLRLSSCTLFENNGQVGEASWHKPSQGWTGIRILRRKKPSHLLEAHVLISTSFRSSPEFRHLQDRQLDPATWESWTETVSFGPI